MPAKMAVSLSLENRDNGPPSPVVRCGEAAATDVCGEQTPGHPSPHTPLHSLRPPSFLTLSQVPGLSAVRTATVVPIQWEGRGRQKGSMRWKPWTGGQALATPCLRSRPSPSPLAAAGLPLAGMGGRRLARSFLTLSPINSHTRQQLFTPPPFPQATRRCFADRERWSR